MWFKMINESFICESCGLEVEIHTGWSARNHCPACLSSKHFDENFPWDRASDCHWVMIAIWIDHKKNKWNMIRHQCQKCGKEMLNKVAPDDNFIDFVKKINKTY